MRIPRFYTPIPLQQGQQLELPPEVFRHAIQVLRLNPGADLILFNGQGGEYLAELTTVGKRHASVQITAFTPQERESPLHLTLVQALIKPDKMDFAIQKSVELGVAAIQPLLSARSVTRPGRDQLDKKQQHWEAVAGSACEQSGRTRLPMILPLLTLDGYLAASARRERLILLPGAHPRLPELVFDSTPRILEVLIGPEGGFDDGEVSACLQAGIRPLALGPRILRAETAALTISSLLQQYFGDL
ncbi:MAG: 16S rRNA (uracil(1498)-N(3))-methyltransferase [Thiothrix sp.]|nr:16S rRNA (uracil(1498)-N(3))-methyltransferase [Thiothrix sp.]HPE62433.1 16S rRNA (uracil(1498)-N(3))-methyltransferase [Thiolinea sp.]